MLEVMLAQTDFPASVGIRKILSKINFVDWPGSVTDGIVFYFSHNLVVCVRPPEIPFPLLSLTKRINLKELHPSANVRIGITGV